jgi:PAS domain-containing protein
MIKNITLLSPEQEQITFEFDSDTILDYIMNDIVDGIVIKDKQGRYVWANNAGASFLNRPIDEIIGKTDFELFEVEAALKIRASDEEVMAKGSAETYIAFLKPASAEGRQFKAIKRAYKDMRGQVQGIINIVRSVSPEEPL